MEKYLDTILDTVRIDAITKLKKAANKQTIVLDAAKDIMKLADLARKEGLLALENVLETITSDLLKQLILLVVDGTFPDLIIEIATNIYWTKAPDGEEAMVDYIYIRGMIGIQNGENLRTLDKILKSLMPFELCQKYQAQMEVLHQKEVVEKLFNIHPSFQDSETLESIHNLKKIVYSLPNRGIQRLLRELDNKDLAICIYVLQQDVRKKLLDNLSVGLAQSIMEDVSLCVSISEKNVSLSVLKVLDTINFLLETGEIAVSDKL